MENYKRILKLLEKLGHSRTMRTAFFEWLYIASFEMGLDSSNNDALQRYEATKKRYTADELAIINEITELVKRDAKEDPGHDLLGDIYMEIIH